MRIDTITPAQAARFGEWAERWIEIGLSTKPADFEAATAAALRGYELANLKRPVVILRMGSPYGATLGGAMAWAFLREILSKKQVGSQVGSQVRSQVESQVGSQVRSQVESQVRSQVGSQVRSQVRSQVWSQVESQVGSQVRSQVESQVWSQVWSQVLSQVRSQVLSQVWSQVESQVGSQVRSQVRSQVWSQVESQVWSQVESQVGSQVRSQVRSQVWSGAGNDFNGGFWASWGAYITFIRDVLGWRDPILERFEIDETLIKSCGWVWWHENVLAISDRPSELHRDARGRLHSPIGPSIAYRDGWKLYHWHGVLVPDYVIEAPTRIKTGTIELEKNAEVRRAMIERYGQERYLLDSGAELVCSDGYGELYRKALVDDEPLVMVKVKNSTPEPDGSIKDYFLRVPPTTRTPHEAVAWTFGATTKEYAPWIET